VSAEHPENSALKNTPDRLLIVRLSSMGDILHTLPAAAALRRAFPATEIGWVVEERWADLLCAHHYARSGPRSPQRPLVDRLHFVNTKGWRRSLFSWQTAQQIAAALSDLRGVRYQVAIDFQGAARSAVIARWSGAPVVYGDAEPRENVASMVYTRPVITSGAHVVQQALSLAEAVAGRRLDPSAVDLPRDEAVEAKCETRLREWGIADFALLNPGAGWGAKQWPAERYGEVAIGLATQGLSSLINFGPGEETLAKTAEAASGGTARRISCSISELIAFTRRARLFIGGDTGPMHLAAALQVPVVAIFGPTNPARNGPFGTRSVVLRSPFSDTSHARRVEPDPGLLQITPAEVLASARVLLENSRA
jgi:lipopolysaccharide heptosyltransferase I